jgi:integrase
MNFVEPIRDRKKIAQIKNLLRGQERFRDLLLFTVGVNTALRISDLLQLQIGQFLDDRGRSNIASGFTNKNGTNATKWSSIKASEKHSKNIWRLILVLLKILSTLCSSTPRQMATPSPSSEDRLEVHRFDLP